MKKPIAAVVASLMAGTAHARVSCEDFKAKVNDTLQGQGKTALEWERASSFKGFNSVNPSASGIKAAIECNDAGELVELGASVPSLDDADKTAEPVFVRGMLLAIDPKLTSVQADDLATKARQRLVSLSKATGSYRMPMPGYVVTFERAPGFKGGVRFRYELEPGR
ncbi:hypothetical protein GGR34_001580 [Microvirga flocculans]|uniref:Uncharacterized protein n=1 Tax=Microvirga flocculans TaxID=217168 RepID=A0A7W6N810_9HYPH|nr:hypothetical protein [Microvirga flocculans]MBB4039933.1 hypothetical protein [Microvirga flocculans]